MHFVDQRVYAWENHSEERQSTPLHPGCGNLRRAIRGNIVSFPSQVPILVNRPSADMQRRAALLYFVRGWSTSKIAKRFSVPKHRIWTLLNEWSIRALAIGYVQVIDPEAFAACCCTDIECGIDHDSEEMRLAEFRPVFKSLPQPFPEAPPAMARTPDGTQPGSWPVDSPGQSLDLIAALDVAISHCDEWRDEFWVRTATLLRDPRTVAAAALEVQRSGEQTELLFTVLEGGNGSLQNGLRVREEERISHAVA
jgi:hypothetical protein